VNIRRGKLAQPIYLAATAMAMVGWMWALFEGIEWLLGA
jgi:hypothetical protein